jgi:hypothetical protein
MVNQSGFFRYYYEKSIYNVTVQGIHMPEKLSPVLLPLLIAFPVTPVPVNTPVSIKIRFPVGAALPFSKITPATITTTNILS